MKNQKIIISGPPSSGKTTIINELRQLGYDCKNEISPPKINLEIKKNKYIVSEFLFSERKKQYIHTDSQVCFYDRSLIDVIAYMNFWNEKYPLDWKNTAHNLKYHQNVFYAPFWDSIYQQNKHRKETMQEAEKIDFFLRQSFLDFNYNIIELPKIDISERTNFIINNI